MYCAEICASTDSAFCITQFRKLARKTAVNTMAALSWEKACSKMMWVWAAGLSWLSGVGFTIRTLSGCCRTILSHQALQRSAYQSSWILSSSTMRGARQVVCRTWWVDHTLTTMVGPVSWNVVRAASSNSALSSKCQIGRGLACGTLGCAGRVAVVKLGGSCWWVSLHFCWRGDGGLELQTCSDALLKNLCKVNWVPIFHAGLCVTGFTCTLVTWDEACGGGAGVCLLTGQLRSGKEHSSVKASTVSRGGEKFGLLP